MLQGSKETEVKFAGRCVVHGCEAHARAWNQWQKELFRSYGPVCARCQPSIVARLLSQPDKGRLRLWCEAIEERCSVVQGWKRFWKPRMRSL